MYIEYVKQIKKTYSFIFAALWTLILFSPVSAQPSLVPDTTIIFTPSDPNLVREGAYMPSVHHWGIDVMLSNNGFGLGLFYRSELSDNLALMINLAISDVKDDAEIEQYDYYGDSYVQGKINRLLLIPFTAGIQYRLFKDDITDNLRPYITAGLGPTMVYISPYLSRTPSYDFWGQPYREKINFFSSLKYGHPRYTIGGFIGAGAFFGSERGTLTGLSLKYFLAPFPDGIEVMEGGYMKNFGGLFITLTMSGLF